MFDWRCYVIDNTTTQRLSDKLFGFLIFPSQMTTIIAKKFPITQINHSTAWMEPQSRQLPLKHTRLIDMCTQKLEKLLYILYTFAVYIRARFEWLNQGLGLNCHSPNSQFIHWTFFVPNQIWQVRVSVEVRLKAKIQIWVMVRSDVATDVGLVVNSGRTTQRVLNLMSFRAIFSIIL